MNKSFQVAPIDVFKEKRGFFQTLRAFIFGISGFLELLAVIVIWVLIFQEHKIFGDFTRKEILTYVLVGNILSLFVKYILRGVTMRNMGKENNELFLRQPFRYLVRVFYRGLGRNFLSFLGLAFINIAVLYFFIDSFIINFDFFYLSVIFVMLVLAFLTEFLLAYLLRLFTFWSWENKEANILIARLKKIVSGNYFPLSFLPPALIGASFILPFAYSFYVPAELYLKKIDLDLGIRGIAVQVVWIIIIYFAIYFVSKNNKRKEEKKKQEKSFSFQEKQEIEGVIRT